MGGYFMGMGRMRSRDGRDVFDIVVGFSKGCVYIRCKSEVMLDSQESMALDLGQVDGYSPSFRQLNVRIHGLD